MQKHADKTVDDFVVDRVFEDSDFKETAVDPMDFLDDKVVCTVMSGMVAKFPATKLRNKAAFLKHIYSKNLWELFGEAFVWTMEL